MKKTEMSKCIKEIYDSLNAEGKKIFMKASKEAAERSVMHPLGNIFRVGGVSISIVSNCDDLEIIYDNDEHVRFHYPRLRSTDEGKEIISKKQGYIYDIIIRSDKVESNLFASSFMQDNEFSKIFDAVHFDKEKNNFTLRTKHVIEDESVAVAYAVAVQEAAKGYGVKVADVLKYGRK